MVGWGLRTDTAHGRLAAGLKSKMEEHPLGDQRQLALQEEVTQGNTGQRVPWVPLPSLISWARCRAAAPAAPGQPAPLSHPLLRAALGRGSF